ncbi:helix-turn-helix domain-containing protein [Actinokineospora enzanensis]|uniref:helix-turn-helix domain-containing protein n=1 Tax=Actinokineospora enzanensis TaxID=155975 RepID=UPI0003683A84|nr:helix-turn-helix transcriptional regulator [Actinokineospora enzanensis]
MSIEPGPVNATVRQWQLTETLRQLREKAGLTMDQAVDILQGLGGKWSKSKISRIENREQGVKSFDVERLLTAYGVTDEAVRIQILDLAAKPAERGHWLALRRDLPEQFHNLFDIEPALQAVRQLETVVVPGLLQTTDYIRALITGANPGLSHDVLERRILARTVRQSVLTRPDPLRYHVVLDESILERRIGSPEVMRGQVGRLIDAAQEKHITIQILAKDTGATPAVNGPFSVLSLPDPIPDFGYTEGPGGSIYIEDRDVVRMCLERWGILTQRALSPERSLDLLSEVGKTS